MAVSTCQYYFVMNNFTSYISKGMKTDAKTCQYEYLNNLIPWRKMKTSTQGPMINHLLLSQVTQVAQDPSQCP